MASVKTPVRHLGCANKVRLVTPRWLAAHIGDPAVRIVEVDVSPAVFDEGHVQGAVLWNVYRDLKDADYRLVGRSAVQDLFERSGIDPTSVVVFYGYAPAMGAWLMRLYRHAEVCILDCSRGAWRDRGRPWTTGTTAPDRTRYPIGEEDEELRATQATMAKAIDDATCTILDVRTEAEFRGERFWPSGGVEPGGRPGHVPGARHAPIEDLYDEAGAFRDTDHLRRMFPVEDPAGDGAVITYCTIGGRAATAWFVLTSLLGREHVRVYDGSWAEWGRMPAVPVVCPLACRIPIGRRDSLEKPNPPGGAYCLVLFA